MSQSLNDANEAATPRTKLHSLHSLHSLNEAPALLEPDEEPIETPYPVVVLVDGRVVIIVIKLGPERSPGFPAPLRSAFRHPDGAHDLLADGAWPAYTADRSFPAGRTAS